MTAKTKLAQKRLTLLQLAEKLGNVSQACQVHKVSRSQFYKYKRPSSSRFDEINFIFNKKCGCKQMLKKRSNEKGASIQWEKQYFRYAE